MVDTFRMFDDRAEQYSWWSYRAAARKRNIGWRIDYLLASPKLVAVIDGAEILNDIMGSDHCPVGIELAL